MRSEFPTRRDVVCAIASLAALANAPLQADTAGAAPVIATSEAPPFSVAWLDEHARQLASVAYVPPSRVAGGAFEMDYNQYRALRYRRPRAIWAEEASRFQVELFHAGYLYREPVELFLVQGGATRRIEYDADVFRFDPPANPPEPGFAGAYAGFRLLTDIHSPSIIDEFMVFLGASYFRGIARNQDYGLSARGLAIDTTQTSGEEFPIFRSFWIERSPGPRDPITVHALMDSPSVAGAFSFRIEPFGKATLMDVDARFFPRRTIVNAGIAPLTSMFFVGPAGQTKHDDFRERVHDSEALAIHTGAGERIWRPLVNATTLQYSGFKDVAPKGFGLIQRNRKVEDYQDLVVRSDIRPSAWVETVGDWGQGAIVLHEIPTNNEYMDNIVAYWQPAEPLEPGTMRRYRYRLHWCRDIPGLEGIGRIVQTRTGQFIQPPTDRLLTIDITGVDLCTDCDATRPQIYFETFAPSAIGTHAIGDNPIDGGVRVAVQFKPNGANSNDIKAWFERDGKRITETWVYRWAKS